LVLGISDAKKSTQQSQSSSEDMDKGVPIPKISRYSSTNITRPISLDTDSRYPI